VRKALKYLALSFMLGGVLTAQSALSETQATSDSAASMEPQSGAKPEKNISIGRYDADPESGTVVGDIYTNAYFGLSLPLPPGWTEGLAGPPPSDRGLYVLAAMDGTKASSATMLIVAQDQFFSAKPLSHVADAAADFRDAMAGTPELSIDQTPGGITIGGHDFLRLDYHAGGLYRVWLATELRCHVISFHITGTDQATVDRLAGFLQTMSLPPQSNVQTVSISDAERTPPTCMKDYVTAQTTVRRVDPLLVDLNGLTVPVRIIIGADGKVRHVHVISATPTQHRAIEEALTRWEFGPFELAGRPTEVETGLAFEFKSRRP
jgi:Gram-negative bacterial TonB protein C-terminal